MAEVESFLDLGEDLSNVPELVTVEPGERELRIIEVTKGTSKKTDKNGNPSGDYLQARFEILGEPNAKTVSHVMMLPRAVDDERTVMNKKRSVKAFCEAFHIPLNGPIVFNECAGLTGWAILDESESQEYGKQNNVKRFVTGS